MDYKFSFVIDGRAYQIPKYMQHGIRMYIENGIEPGGFLRSILENDFMGAAMKADSENIKNLPAYASFLFNEVPSSCYGSPKKVENWMKYKRRL